MKTIIANNRQVQIVEENIPKVVADYVLIKTVFSVISPGTEISMLTQSEGQRFALGYSALGKIIECGEGTEPFQKGDLIACYGAPYVRHSEYLLVPKTLCRKIPDSVDPKEGALGGLGAIAIHALRIANLQFGETAIVAGLGILGQLLAQIAHAASYQVIPYDISPERASQFQSITGIKSMTTAEQLEDQIQRQTEDQGADAVFLCAGGKKSSLTTDSLKWIRDKGKVIIVGDIEPLFPRNLMFSKEAQILISRAGGPGRYDPIYEKNAVDYPYGFVRWTEGRNVGEYLRLLAQKKINVTPYVQDVTLLEKVEEAFQSLMTNHQSLTKVIQYEEGVDV